LYRVRRFGRSPPPCCGIGAGAGLVQHTPAHGRDDHAARELDDGQRDAEEIEDGRAQQLENRKENDVVDGDAARQGAKDLGRRIADQAEKDQGGAERVDQRQEHAERDEKGFPNWQEKSPLMNLNCFIGRAGRLIARGSLRIPARTCALHCETRHERGWYSGLDGKKRDECNDEDNRSPAGRRSRQCARCGCFLRSFWATIYFASLFSPPLLDDVDAAHAQAAQHMAESGDLITAKTNGIRYIEKPPLPYWLVAGCTRSSARTLLPRTCPTRWPCWG
jgi:hypothetical protein